MPKFSAYMRGAQGSRGEIGQAALWDGIVSSSNQLPVITTDNKNLAYFVQEENGLNLYTHQKGQLNPIWTSWGSINPGISTNAITSVTTLNSNSTATVKVTVSQDSPQNLKVLNFNFGIPQGKQGVQGEKGNTGEAAGFTTPAASVTALAAGAEPTVDIVASGSNTNKKFTFNFGIPRASVEGILSINKGGTNASSATTAICNLLHTSITTPDYFLTITSHWNEVGYTNKANAWAVLGGGSIGKLNSLSASDIPDLDTSKITTGTFNINRIPTIPLTSKISGILPIANGGTNINSNPSMLVNLASTSAANIFASTPRPGVTGVLPIEKGGTGAATSTQALKNLGIAEYNQDFEKNYLKLTGGTLTGNLTIDNSRYIRFRSTTTNGLTGARLYLREKGINHGNNLSFWYENPSGEGMTLYSLPEVDESLTGYRYYNILTSKEPVTITQGGTGTTILTAGEALIGNGTEAIQTRAITNNTSKTYIVYNTNLMTTNTLAYWNGAYSSAGNSNITNVGTIAKGVWNGTIIDVTYGGTGRNKLIGTNSLISDLFPNTLATSASTLWFFTCDDNFAHPGKTQTSKVWNLIKGSAVLSDISGTLPIDKGGTNATSATTAVANLFTSSITAPDYFLTYTQNHATVGYTPVSKFLSSTGGVLSGPLIVKSTGDAAGTSYKNVGLIIGATTGDHIQIDVNEIMAKANETTPSNLFLNKDGGTVDLLNTKFQVSSNSITTNAPLIINNSVNINGTVQGPINFASMASSWNTPNTKSYILIPHSGTYQPFVSFNVNNDFYWSFGRAYTDIVFGGVPVSYIGSTNTMYQVRLPYNANGIGTIRYLYAGYSGTAELANNATLPTNTIYLQYEA